ncbi:MAG: response regulator transcription factor [Firmicutes bacterium]|jgi:DNA-binding NarL/FixJ family response regulator|uniref:Stage 0 sporulation protein A homolog n=1 Tax=Sulfobacillus benefaciens TaxID=453960 RepID=A0A2T2X9H1_9FIRM|nr:response regulator transcription factor [Bacillota bacterium]PSR31096.1 MAG: DNA-binding response regulator [Sulfobacillus benefaciens]HBQ96809.1 DNA-binding response regulator [Sulfobacillus sp.]
MTVSSKLKILVVDDHPVVREGLRTFLGLLPEVIWVGEAQNGEEALAMVSCEHDIDVILMDLVLQGDISGIHVISRLKQIHPEIPVIVLTSYQNSERIAAAMSAGARAYLDKSIDPSRLVDVIHTVLQGDTSNDLFTASALPAPLTIGLTPREYDVLQALSRGMSNKEIAAHLKITEKTVKVHMSHIFAKLSVYDRTQALIVAIRCGLLNSS